MTTTLLQRFSFDGTLAGTGSLALQIPNTVTLGTPTYVTGPVAGTQALAVTTNTYALLPYSASISPNINNSMSCGGWIYTSAVANDCLLISTTYSTSSGGIEFQLYGNSTSCVTNINAVNSSRISYTGGSCNSLNTWMHWWATFDSNTRIMTTYINGVSVNNVIAGLPLTAGTDITTTNAWRINGGRSNTFAGAVADIRWYSGVVSAATAMAATLKVTLTTTNATSYGASTGSIISTVTNGIPPYTYLWSSGEITANINNKISARYSLTVTDSIGAQSTADTIIGPTFWSSNIENLISTTKPYAGRRSVYINGTIFPTLTIPSLKYNLSFTIECFVNISNSTFSSRFAVSENNIQNVQLLIHGGLGSNAYYGNNSGTLTTVTGATSFITNTWLHVAISYDSNANILYNAFNGKVTSASCPPITISQNKPIVFMNRTDAGGFSSIGYFDSVRVSQSCIYTSNYTLPNPFSWSAGGTTLFMDNFDSESVLRPLQQLTFDDGSIKSSGSLALTLSINTSTGTYRAGPTTGTQGILLVSGSQYLKLPYSSFLNFSPTQAFSFGGWLYQTNSVVSHFLCNNNNGIITGMEVQIHSGGTAINVGGWNNSARPGLCGDFTLAASILNAWHHFWVTNDGSIMNIYVDGVLVGGMNMAWTLSTTTVSSGWEIVNGRTANFTGAVADVRWYNGVIPPTTAQMSLVLQIVLSSTSTNTLSNTGTATITATGGNNIFVYAWKKNGTVISDTTSTISNLTPATYDCTVTSGNLTATTSIVILQLLTSSFISTNVSYSNAANGSITLIVLGTLTNVSYAWKKNGVAFATTKNLTNLTPAIYDCVITTATESTTVSTTIIQADSYWNMPIKPLKTVSQFYNGTKGLDLTTVTQSKSSYPSLTVPSLSFLLDFTIEFFYYPTNTGTIYHLTDQANILKYTNGVNLYPPTLYNGSGSNYISSSGVTYDLNAWNHIAVSFNSSTNTLYHVVNGKVFSAMLGPISGTLQKSIYFFQNTSSGEFTAGYIDNIRISQSCIYTSDYTLPLPQTWTLGGNTKYLESFEPITAIYTSTDSSCSRGTITLAVSGSNGIYSYSWSKNNGAAFSTSKNLTGLDVGTYSCTITSGEETATISIVIKYLIKDYDFKFDWDDKIDVKGNIGIGTANPSKTLDINGDIKADKIYQNNRQLANWYKKDNNDIYCFENVGINKSAEKTLDVNGTVRSQARITNSDMRLKTDIEDEPLGIHFVNKLKPKVFDYINNPDIGSVHGFVAQDIAAISEDEKIQCLLDVDEEGYYSVDFNSFISPMIKSIKDLNEQQSNILSRINIINKNKEDNS